MYCPALVSDSDSDSMDCPAFVSDSDSDYSDSGIFSWMYGAVRAAQGRDIQGLQPDVDLEHLIKDITCLASDGDHIERASEYINKVYYQCMQSDNRTALMCAEALLAIYE